MNLTLPAGGTSPPSSLDIECPQNYMRQKLAGATGLVTAVAQLSDSLAYASVSPHIFFGSEIQWRGCESSTRAGYRPRL